MAAKGGRRHPRAVFVTEEEEDVRSPFWLFGVYSKGTDRAKSTSSSKNKTTKINKNQPKTGGERESCHDLFHSSLLFFLFVSIPMCWSVRRQQKRREGRMRWMGKVVEMTETKNRGWIRSHAGVSYTRGQTPQDHLPRPRTLFCHGWFLMLQRPHGWVYGSVYII